MRLTYAVTYPHTHSNELTTPAYLPVIQLAEDLPPLFDVFARLYASNPDDFDNIFEVIFFYLRVRFHPDSLLRSRTLSLCSFIIPASFPATTHSSSFIWQTAVQDMSDLSVGWILHPELSDDVADQIACVCVCGQCLPV